MKRTSKDWCEFFKSIERDPHVMVTGFTIGDMLAGRAHIAECPECDERVNRVLDEAPPEPPFGHIGFN